jgi:hypothetical protein
LDQVTIRYRALANAGGQGEKKVAGQVVGLGCKPIGLPKGLGEDRGLGDKKTSAGVSYLKPVLRELDN